MQLTPSQAFEHIKESVVGYLEAAYKISHPAVYAERSEILRRQGTVAQAPFVEATPAFPTSRKLVDLARDHQFVPSGLAELVRYGVPVGRFPLWTHQEKSLLSAFSEHPNLLVATGTGSGKTECFLLPILCDILNEAVGWSSPSGPAAPGHYDSERDTWLHSRRHESRPAALRAIILYPMNALVNDQLARLRRILARGTSPDWQRRNMNGNVIHFGMYTSLTPRAGHWSDEWRRDAVREYLEGVREDWANLRDELRETGSWPRPDSPEMLVRWDMQQAPPDVLVTNYSMLEYMLVRPIEYPIFDMTRRWLNETEGARFTLVLDEAHTYTGAKGTEVAHLVRRLKERLGIKPASDSFRAIATTASVPAGEDKALRHFISDLFGEPQNRFTLVELEGLEEPDPEREPEEESMRAFIRFHDEFDLRTPLPALEKLSEDLRLGQLDHTLDAQVAAYTLLENQEDIRWVRQRTARRATLVDELADEAWRGLGTADDRRRATSGVLAAGSFARAEALADTPPLISMRLHAFFRGIPGVWACMNPDCPEVAEEYRSPDRPIGKLYVEPRPWCSPECGGRVLELFSCRRCGLLFLGGIPDSHEGSLWPWSDDLEGGRQDLKDFKIFGVEEPHPDYPVAYRSTQTTLSAHPEAEFAREVYEIEPAVEGGKEVSPFPQKCPRCSNYRQFGVDGREVIEPLRTKGPRSLAMIVEDAYRVQVRAVDSEPPNYGRKALLFTDSRMQAAQLAGDLRQIHQHDLFRQLLYRVLHSCPTCNGSGFVKEAGEFVIGEDPTERVVQCSDCRGSGRADDPEPLGFQELQNRVIDIQLNRDINPTNGYVPDFFRRVESGSQTVYDEAEMAFNVALRRELSQDEFGLEPLGLAKWCVTLPEETGAFEPLTELESKVFLRIVTRILASENILLPPNPYKPWAWPRDQVAEWERYVMIPASGRQKGVIPYNLRHYRKLGRYAQAVADALLESGRLSNDEERKGWIAGLYWPLWNALQPYGFGVMDFAGKKINGKPPMGIRIDVFELHPVGDTVEQCQSCGYIMSEALLHVCARCGHRTEPTAPSDLDNFYRRIARFALPDVDYDDPYPLRSTEHTAQISRTEARNIERWFQDLFRENQHPADYRVDVLSVTTTMEMGIDIGSLLTVGLRNVPPTVANYQQRSGRAGRRGSSIATVLTYAQFRSHDQYYFDRPPEIVSAPPRVPALYLENEVIARRHVRSLVLQDFFYRAVGRKKGGGGLFRAWGRVKGFENRNRAEKLQKYLSTNRAPLVERCEEVVHPSFCDDLPEWMGALVEEVQEAVEQGAPKASLLETLIGKGLLPKYAFPVDVVGLSVPSSALGSDSDPYGYEDRMQRDLRIALAEYAPGAEVIKGSFPDTYICRVAGVYDPFDKDPDYRPTGKLLECPDCQAIDLLDAGASAPDSCPECGSFGVYALPYLRPNGFTVDQAEPNAGCEEYRYGGREWAGYVAPARLLVGETSLASGRSRAPYAPDLYTRVQVGELFVCNKGPDRSFPGFLICPDCGRALDPDDPSSHTYPAPVPPHRGRHKGPRAGELCPNRSDFQNMVVLGHNFHSEVVLFGVDLPQTMDAPFLEVAGKAVWYSLGTLIKNAATVVLQVDPEEVAVGVRPIRRSPGRIHGEIFIYDNVPGGAGYARAIDQHMEAILLKALDLGGECSNPECSGACYHCLFDYRNQYLHPLLDRELGTSILRYLLHGKMPRLEPQQADKYAGSLAEYVRATWEVLPGQDFDDIHIAHVFKDKQGRKYGVHVIHPAQVRPTKAKSQAVLAALGVRLATHTSFDLERRPFWVVNNLT